MDRLLTLADFENLYLLHRYELIDREEFRRLHDLNVRQTSEQKESAHRFALQPTDSGEANEHKYIP